MLKLNFCNLNQCFDIFVKNYKKNQIIKKGGSPISLPQIPHLCPIFSRCFSRAFSATSLLTNCTYASPELRPEQSVRRVIPLGTISNPTQNNNPKKFDETLECKYFYQLEFFKRHTTYLHTVGINVTNKKNSRRQLMIL